MAGFLGMCSLNQNAWNFDVSMPLGLGNPAKGIYHDGESVWTIDDTYVYQGKITPYGYIIDRSFDVKTLLGATGLTSIAGDRRNLFIGHIVTSGMSLSQPKVAIIDKNFNFTRLLNSMTTASGLTFPWGDLTYNGKYLYGVNGTTRLPVQYFFVQCDPFSDKRVMSYGDNFNFVGIAFDGNNMRGIIKYFGGRYGALMTQTKLYKTGGFILGVNAEGMDTYKEDNPQEKDCGRVLIVYN